MIISDWLILILSRDKCLAKSHLTSPAQSSLLSRDQPVGSLIRHWLWGQVLHRMPNFTLLDLKWCFVRKTSVTQSRKKPLSILLALALPRSFAVFPPPPYLVNNSIILSRNPFNGIYWYTEYPIFFCCSSGVTLWGFDAQKLTSSVLFKQDERGEVGVYGNTRCNRLLELPA